MRMLFFTLFLYQLQANEQQPVPVPQPVPVQQSVPVPNPVSDAEIAEFVAKNNSDLVRFAKCSLKDGLGLDSLATFLKNSYLRYVSLFATTI